MEHMWSMHCFVVLYVREKSNKLKHKPLFANEAHKNLGTREPASPKFYVQREESSVETLFHSFIFRFVPVQKL